MSKGLFGRVQDELSAREKTPGLGMGDLFAMPAGSTRSLLIFMVREREGDLDLASLVTHLKKDEGEVRLLLESLLEQGFIRKIDIKSQVRYRIRLASTRKQGSNEDVWAAALNKIQSEGQD